MAVGEIVDRLRDLRLAVDAADVAFHTAFDRRPRAVRVTFTPEPG